MVPPMGYSIETRDVPPTGEAAMNRNPNAVEISVVEAGDVDGWEEIGANGSVSSFSPGLTVGQRFICDPDDQVRLHYSAAPRRRRKALGRAGVRILLTTGHRGARSVARPVHMSRLATHRSCDANR